MKILNKITRRTLSIRTKLILAFMLIVIPIVLLGVISLTNTGQAIHDVATRSAQKSLEISADYVNLLFESVENMSVQITENINVTNYLNKASFNPGDNGKLITEYLQNTVNKSDILQDIVIIPVNGQTVSTSGYDNGAFTFDKVQKDEVIKKCLKLNGGIAWAGLHSGLDTAKKVNDSQFSITAAKAIKGTDASKPIAVMIIDIKLDAIKSLLENTYTSTTGTTHLISPDEKDIAYTSEGFDKASMTNSSFTSQHFFKKIQNGVSLKGSSDITYAGKENFLAFSRVGTTNYLLISTIPYTELNASADTIAVSTIILTVLAILTSVILGLIISISMVKEIRQMLTAANAAAEGNLTVNYKTTRKDELGILSIKMMEMISNMRSLISQTAGIMGVVDEYASKVSSSSSNISATSMDISAAIQQIASCISLQAREIEQANAEITGLTDMIEKSSENAVLMHSASEASGRHIKSGLLSVEQLESTYQETVDCTEKVIQDISVLDEKSKSINKIVQAIAQVADQTKLLAFNASIEAARAGDAGLGFSVIATEVRRLSEKALASTSEAEKIVSDISNMISNVVFDTVHIEKSMKSQDAALLDVVSSFNSISSQVNYFSAKSNEIVAALAEMNRKKESTINNIAKISANTQETAAASEEVAASAGEQTGWLEALAGQANEMKLSSGKLSDMINIFKM